jgi:streptogramin lyase
MNDQQARGWHLLWAAITLVSLDVGRATCEPTIRTYAGTGEAGYSGNGGPATQAKISNPFDVALDAAGNLYFSESGNHCVRKVDAKTGVISTVAGTGKKGDGGDGGPATKAQLNDPYGVTLDRDGNLFIVDRLNFRIRRVGANGMIETIAGTGKSGFGGDGGPGAQALLKEPNGICLDGKGRLFIADVADQRVRVLDLASGKIDTLCGTGKRLQAGDGGPYREASLMGPRAVAVGPDGNLFVCEREGHAVRKIDFASGKIERVAGTGKKGYDGDGGPAVAGTFNGPKEIDVDRQGNIFVVDTENHAIRKIDAKTGKLSTIAGTGKSGGSGDDGPATKATLARPHGVAAGPDGAIFIGDTLNHRIRVVK